jgi:hypothetical protein
MKEKVTALLAVAALLGVLSFTALAQRGMPRSEQIGDGILLDVLPMDRIPAVDAPRFLSAAEADKLLRDNEPVLGVFDGEVAKAYSLWQLDHHEIVNDTTPKFGPIAVTW